MGKARKPKSAPHPAFAEAAPAAREVMDIKSLASYLGIGKSKIYALIRMKKIPASRIGRQYRFSKEIVDNWLKEKLITQGVDQQISMFAPEGGSKRDESA